MNNRFNDFIDAKKKSIPKKSSRYDFVSGKSTLDISLVPRVVGASNRRRKLYEFSAGPGMVLMHELLHFAKLRKGKKTLVDHDPSLRCFDKEGNIDRRGVAKIGQGPVVRIMNRIRRELRKPRRLTYCVNENGALFEGGVRVSMSDMEPDLTKYKIEVEVIK